MSGQKQRWHLDEVRHHAQEMQENRKRIRLTLPDGTTKGHICEMKHVVILQ